MTDKHILLTCPQMRRLAREICEYEPLIEQGELTWDRFPDGFPNLFVHKYRGLRKAHLAFLMCLDRLDTFFEQISVLHELVRLGPRSLKILLPFFPVGTMERADEEGQVPTAETLAVLLSRMIQPGPHQLVTYDVHALPIRGFFESSITPVFRSGTKRLKERMKDGWQDASICFPDKGAWSRFKSMFDGTHDKEAYPMIICDKVRGEGYSRVVTVKEGDPKGRRIIIVDDLIHGGGTAKECRNALMNSGAAEVAVYATHGVMEQEAWKRFADFSRVWITDSCPATAEAVRGIEPFEILSLAPSLSRAILD